MQRLCQEKSSVPSICSIFFLSSSFNNGGSFTTPVAQSKDSSGVERPNKNQDEKKPAAPHNPFDDSFHQAVAAHVAVLAAERRAAAAAEAATAAGSAAARLDFSSPRNEEHHQSSLVSRKEVDTSNSSGGVGVGGGATAAMRRKGLLPAPTPPPGSHPSINMQVGSTKKTLKFV